MNTTTNNTQNTATANSNTVNTRVNYDALKLAISKLEAEFKKAKIDFSVTESTRDSEKQYVRIAFKKKNVRLHVVYNTRKSAKYIVRANMYFTQSEYHDNWAKESQYDRKQLTVDDVVSIIKYFSKKADIVKTENKSADTSKSKKQNTNKTSEKSA